MARFSTPVLQLTILAILCVLFSISPVAAQTASGGSVVTAATSNGTYTLPTQSATTASSGSRTTSTSSPAATSSINGASSFHAPGDGNMALGMIFAGVAVGVGAAFGL